MDCRGRRDRREPCKIWPLQREPGIEVRTLDIGAAGLSSPLRVSPQGDFLIAGTMGGVRLIHLDGRPPERLDGFNGMVTGLALDPSGNLLAGGGGVQGELAAPGEAVVRVWNLDTREVTSSTRATDSQVLVSTSCPMAGCLRPAPPACASGICAPEPRRC